MEAVTNQSGSTRISPLVVAAAASLAIASLIGAGAVVLSGKRSPTRDDAPLSRVEPKPAQQSPCGLCGTVEAIRTVEVWDEANRSGGSAESRSSAETDGMSVLDTLSSALTGSDDAKSARKRYAYRVTVRMDDGSFRAVSLSSPPAFAVGDKVRVVEGRLVRS